MTTSSRGVPPLVVAVFTLLAFGSGIAFAWVVGAATDRPNDNSSVLATSIAVLPFTNLSGANRPDTAGADLTSGVAEALSSLRDVRVVSGHAVDSAWTSSRSLSSVARTLAVTHVLEGSVRFVGSRVRVSVQLVNATDDRWVFQDTWDLEAKDLPRFYEDLQYRVAAAIRQVPG